MVHHIFLEEAVSSRTSRPVHHPSAERYSLPGIRSVVVLGTLKFNVQFSYGINTDVTLQL